MKYQLHIHTQSPSPPLCLFALAVITRLWTLAPRVRQEEKGGGAVASRHQPMPIAQESGPLCMYVGKVCMYVGGWVDGCVSASGIDMLVFKLHSITLVHSDPNQKGQDSCVAVRYYDIPSPSREAFLSYQMTSPCRATPYLPYLPSQSSAYRGHNDLLPARACSSKGLNHARFFWKSPINGLPGNFLCYCRLPALGMLEQTGGEAPPKK